MNSSPASNSFPPFSCGSLQECLAGYFLLLEVDQVVLGVRELADILAASTGSISAAINSLEDQGAIALHRAGRQGTRLEGKDYGTLWNQVGKGPLVIALTLPAFPKAEGLATAISTLLSQAGVEAYLTFIRGSINRLDTLRRNRCHATVISEFAAEGLCTAEEEVILRLPPQSFVTDHRVVYRTAHPTGRALRVATDPDSYDISKLTELEFADQDVELVPLSFVQTDLYLSQSPVDAGISNSDHLIRRPAGEIHSRPLSPAVTASLGNRDTSAVLVVKAGNPHLRHLLTRLLPAPSLTDIQNRVCDGLLVPRY